jgi:hypothetical protein
LPECAKQLTYVENRSVIRTQVLGEALDCDKLERLGRYEVQLDRKLERMLAMLLRLQDFRRSNKGDDQFSGESRPDKRGRNGASAARLGSALGFLTGRGRMPAERTAMRHVREVLRLRTGVAGNEIARR